MKATVRRGFRDTRGLTTVEYIIVLGLIAITAVGTWRAFGERLLEYISTSIDIMDSMEENFDRGNSRYGS